MGDPVFRGLDTLLTVLRTLMDRPRALRADQKPYPSERTRRGHSWERALPVMCLIGGQGTRWAKALDDRLGRASPPKVLYVTLDVDEVARDQRPAEVTAASSDPGSARPRVLPLLTALSKQLAADRFGNQRVRGFRTFQLVEWLARQPARTNDTADSRTALLRTWHRARSTSGAEATEPIRVTGPGGVVFTPSAIARWLRFQWWVRLGRERSWLMGQPFLLPGNSESFAGFAEWLVEASHRDDARDELGLLMVHAFLQDLRREFGTGTWRLRRGRRTAHVLVLLTGVSEHNGGWDLLRLINDVRNRSTEPDPVLVVATAEALPPGRGAGEDIEPVHRLHSVLTDWARRLPEQRQFLHRDARFVVVRMPPADDGPEEDRDDSGWTEVGHPRPRPVPRLIRKVTTRLASLVLVAGLLVGIGLWIVPRWIGDCLPQTHTGVSTRLVETAGGRECVGYSDRASQLFGDSSRLRAVQRAVFEMNELAGRLHAESAARPLISVVYFAELTKPDGQLGADDSTVEQLTGLLLLQGEVNRRSDHAAPLLRVVIANAGFNMRQARTAVDLLLPLLARDSTIVGVVGMGRTVDPVEDAITALGDVGVPVVGTTLTGVGLTERSPLYFQVTPDNHQQAALVKRYADQAGKELSVYQPTNVESDGYLLSLRDEMAKLVRREAFHPWTEVSRSTPVCGTDQIAFYAGRQVDFDRFLDRVLDVCGRALPVIIGDDTVARFVAQHEKRGNAKYSGKSILYVSLGPVTVLQNRTCFPENTEPLTPLCADMHDLVNGADVYGEAGREFGRDLRERPQSWIGERVGLSYDAAGVLLQAATASRVSHRAAVAQELRETACTLPATTTRNCYEGASGPVDLSRFRDGRDRPLALLLLADVHNTAQAPQCALLVSADQNLCR
ncbi:hypothetical protein [Actinokineospora sp. NBRC 105648]|uniref:hypothetical protein n=1 Tax=Actinokineospora sp. NBRC 105648 TaxID=3032206 RepID=UPI0024A06834|nr:hypothetical protein [Actinokineospora sp. NBRC 105648]GLZ43633.1 hypothetical protein Acsp05_72570 [Actinokineospora sp. NBRC 105648]